MACDEDDSFAEIYRSYKVSTDYFLQWLWSQHQSIQPKPASVPRTTKGILTAAKALSQAFKKTKHSVPASIISSLRNAISKRREAVAVYEELGADDINHGVLEQTLSILTPFMARSLAPAAVATNADKASTANAFASLATLAGELDRGLDHPYRVPASTSLPPQNDLGPSCGPTSDTAPFEVLLEDDELSDFMEIIALLDYLEGVKSDMKQYWADAAKGILPLPLASWLTNLTFRQLQVLFKRFHGTSRDLENHCRRAHKFFTDHPNLEARFKIRGMSGAVRFCIISQAVNNHPRKAEFYEQFSKERNGQMCMLHELMPQDPTLLIPPRKPPVEMPEPDGDIEAPEHWAVIEIFKHIKRDMKEGRGIADLEIWDEAMECPSERILPLALADIRDPQVPASLELVLCMDIFLTSYETFLWADGKHNKQNCRLQALRLAKDMQKSIVSAIGSLKKLTRDMSYFKPWIGFQQELYDVLDTYLREKAFDFYHQAPWTAGGHISEMLYKAGSTGEGLCFITPFVPSTLHMYNALAHSAFGMKKIPLMEDLCDLLVDPVFLGSRPTKNYLSHYRRAVWGAKRNKKGVPDDIDDNDYRFHPEYMAIVFGERPELARTSAVRSKMRNMSVKTDVSSIIEKSKELVLPEFRGRLPIARLDMFRIFTVCVEILEKLSMIVQEHEYEGGIEHHMTFDNHIIKGHNMIDILLGFIVQFSGDQYKEETLRGLYLPRTAALAFFLEVDEDAKLEEYLWNI
ncbi:hypothetical protein GCG54_00001390 [Colletotrichum gloeosporioides]|uniref:DUF6604 domain-containing protein n=1 Tax=Colletotrichum gloeosporioides TaxID=474922 RepID=A0A8H4C8D9_COLGL|nr:uncharacterized protein GCG54_00001390 [Colletotrichum gloeosporioides]KAF3799348.1 hypothetical protein GCG54_00001390 [Colletotrichum gloeosporioides]